MVHSHNINLPIVRSPSSSPIVRICHRRLPSPPSAACPSPFPSSSSQSRSHWHRHIPRVASICNMYHGVPSKHWSLATAPRGDCWYVCVVSAQRCVPCLCRSLPKQGRGCPLPPRGQPRTTARRVRPGSRLIENKRSHPDRSMANIQGECS
jgi:hypothetical protein